MSVKFDGRKLPDGTVLRIGVRFTSAQVGLISGRAKVTTYTYILLKTAGLWYATGTGRVPQAAGWGAVEKWLDREDREVVSIEHATGWGQLWPVEVPEPVEAPENCPDHPDDPGAGECHFDSCGNCGGYHCGWVCPDEV